jgi:hypothetical protein
VAFSRRKGKAVLFGKVIQNYPSLSVPLRALDFIDFLDAGELHQGGDVR